MNAFGERACIVTFDNFYRALNQEQHEDALNDSYDFDNPKALDFEDALTKFKELRKY